MLLAFVLNFSLHAEISYNGFKYPSNGKPVLYLAEGSLFDLIVYCQASDMGIAENLNTGYMVTVSGTCNVILGKVCIFDAKIDSW
jgi:hypothetical protein